MASNSDAKLRAELSDAGHKSKPQRVTHAQAVAEAKGKPARTNAKPARASSTDDGEQPAKQARVRIAPGTKPSGVLMAYYPDQDALHDRARLLKSDEPGKAGFTALSKAIDGLAKKVGEKAVNLVRNRENPDGVQVYTRIAMDHLLDQGTLTSKSLADVYRAGSNGRAGYKEGTVRAQTNQIMGLFPALGVATREDKGTLKLNKDSLIVAEYRKAKNKAERAAAHA